MDYNTPNRIFKHDIKIQNFKNKLEPLNFKLAFQWSHKILFTSKKNVSSIKINDTVET